MRKITIDCKTIADRTDMHECLARELDFPDWYGKNLDALYDCLTELDSVHLHLVGWQQLGTWKAGFEAVLSDAENDCLDFTVSYE